MNTQLAYRSPMTEDSAVEEHRRRARAIKSAIRESLLSSGHVVDTDIRFVNGQYVGLFVLPGPGSIYIGYGPMGSLAAYHGPDGHFDPVRVAGLIIRHIQS